MTMKLGWNLLAFDWFSPQIPCVNIAKTAQEFDFQNSTAGASQIFHLDSAGVPLAAWSAVTNTRNISQAEPGDAYGHTGRTVITTATEHDYTTSTRVRIAGNTGGVTNGDYTVYAVLNYTQFVLNTSVAGATGAVGTVQCAPVNYQWSPLANTEYGIAGHYPSGVYDVYNAMNVNLDIGNDAVLNNITSGSWGTPTVTPSASGLKFYTRADWSSGGGFKAILPTYKAAYEAGTTYWHPTFIANITANSAACIRHMDDTRTSNSNVRTWDQRTPGTRYNSIHGREIKRRLKITASAAGGASTFFNSSNTIALTVPTHGLTTGDVVDVTINNSSGPVWDTKHFLAEVIDEDTLRVWTTQAASITWGWLNADVLPGMSYEDIISLHNLTGQDCWVCIPHLADDAYVTAMATLFATTLDADVKVYVEWSNETWQGTSTTSFLQGMYCSGMATSDGTYNTKNKWAGKRARECFALWDAAYVAAGITDPRTRVVRVGATQLASTSVTNDYLFGLTHPVSGKVMADAMAVAPYYKDRESGSYTYTDLETLKSQCLTHISGTLTPRLAAQAAIILATTNDAGAALKFIAYEGGHELQDPNAIAQSFATSNERYECDLAILSAAEAAGITLWCHFAFQSKYASSGSAYYQWGALQWYDDVEQSATRPTWDALGDYFGVPPASPMGFLSPFPWVYGMFGGVPLAYEITGVPRARAYIRTSSHAKGVIRSSAHVQAGISQ